FAWKNAETKDFQKIVEMVSGKNLGNFFQQWLFRGENPKLKLGWVYDAKTQAINISVEQLQNELFSFPLEVGWGNRTEKVLVSKKLENFRIGTKTKVDNLVFDPNTSLLFERAE